MVNICGWCGCRLELVNLELSLGCHAICSWEIMPYVLPQQYNTMKGAGWLETLQKYDLLFANVTLVSHKMGINNRFPSSSLTCNACRGLLVN